MPFLCKRNGNQANKILVVCLLSHCVWPAYPLILIQTWLETRLKHCIWQVNMLNARQVLSFCFTFLKFHRLEKWKVLLVLVSLKPNVFHHIEWQHIIMIISALFHDQNEAYKSSNAIPFQYSNLLNISVN